MKLLPDNYMCSSSECWKWVSCGHFLSSRDCRRWNSCFIKKRTTTYTDEICCKRSTSTLDNIWVTSEIHLLKVHGQANQNYHFAKFSLKTCQKKREKKELVSEKKVLKHLYPTLFQPFDQIVGKSSVSVHILSQYGHSSPFEMFHDRHSSLVLKMLRWYGAHERWKDLRAW